MLYPELKKHAVHISDVNKQVIVHLNYKKNYLTKQNLRQETQSFEFGQLTYSHTDTVHRVTDAQPLVTFRLHIDANAVHTDLTQEGDQLFTCILDALSLIGGLFTTLGAFTAIVIHKLTKADFATYVMKQIYLARKPIGDKVWDAAANRVVAAHCRQNYEELLGSLKSKKVKTKDIKNLVDEILLNR